MLMNFRQRLKEAQPILLDGALGTELQRRGQPTTLPLWSAQALLDHPEVVKQIHREYVEAGAEIITTNTFRTNVRTLRRAQVGRTGEELTQLAVELAQAARGKGDRDVFIAGSIAPVEDCYRPDLIPPDAQLRQEHPQLANALKKAGVDLILVETMNTLREALIASQAALATGLPVLTSLVLGRNGQLLSGEPLAMVARELSSTGILALLINCSSPSTSRESLKTLKSATPLPVGIYANGLGHPDDDQGWLFDGGEGAEKYAQYAQQWLDLGAKIIGGCCGTTPEYIARLRKLIDSQKSN